MRKLASSTILLAVAIGLAACGGGDDKAFVGTGTSGTTTGTGGTGTGTTTTSTYSIGSGSGSSFKSGTLEISPATQIGAGGSATITATIADQTGTLYAGTPVTVVFNSHCVGLGTATILGPVGSTLPAGSVSTITGTATATYTAKGCSGSDPITATTTVTSSNGTASNLSATGTVSIAQAAVGSIQFVSATPATIGLKGTGLNETSTVIFKVVDSSGGPRSGVLVTFGLNTTVGGLALSQSSATSGSDGTVQTIVSSGTVHTSVVVSASIASPALSTNSNVLAVSTGLPASAGFSIATGTGSSGNACPNVEAYDIDGVTIPIVVRLADRYNNPAPDGTAVAFTTDGGHIGGNCATPGATPGDGTCTVTWTSANPRPQLADDSPPLKAAGRTTVLATAIGEESFTDTNGNGYYDSGEPFQNLGEPYRDDNENGAYDLGEYFLDFNSNGMRDPPPSPAAFKGITCTGSTSTSTCATTTLAIGATTTIIMSTSQAAARLVSPAGPNLSFSAGSNDAITFNIQDLNGNSAAAGSTVTVAASSSVGTISQGSFTIPCTTALGGENFTSFIAASTTAPATGNISITIVAPSGTTSVLNIPTTITP